MATNNEPPKPPDLIARVDRWMNKKTSEWPDGLKESVDYQVARLGLCGEVVRSAIETYCEDVPEGMEWEDDNFKCELLRRDAELAALRERIRQLEAEYDRYQDLCDTAVDQEHELEVAAEREKSLRAEFAGLQDEIDRLRGLLEAVTPSGKTKAAYRGEFSFDCEHGDSNAVVPWTTIKEIMAAIRKRAGFDDAALKGATE